MKRALSHFGRDQLLFLRSEDLRDDPEATLGQISAFLGIEPFPKVDARREHSQPDFPFPCEPREADRALVAQRLRADLEDFARLTGLDIAEWPTLRG